jgi:hypothetical protein
MLVGEDRSIASFLWYGDTDNGTARSVTIALLHGEFVRNHFS